MARPKTKPQDEELLEPSQEELDLYDFIEEMGGSIASVDVFRVMRDGSMPHVDRVTMDSIREDVYSYLRSLGVGKYCLQFKSADRQIRRRKTIEVADKVPVASTVPAVNGTPPDHMQFMREQMALQQTLIMGLIGALGNNKPVMPDLGFLAGVLKPPDMMPVITLMSAVLNRKEPEGGGLAMAKQIVELSRDLAPDGNKEDSLWSVVKEVGGGFVKTLDKHLPAQLGPYQGGRVEDLAPGTQPTQTAQVVTVRQITPPAKPPEVSPVPSVQVTPANFQDWLRSALIQLKGKAALGKDVELMVDYIMDNTDEPQWSAIAGAIQQGATFDNLLTFDPEIAQSAVLKPWFKALYDGLHTEIFNPVDTAGEGGDPDDARNHAGSGPTGPAPGTDPPTS